jgi:uncharacterized protein with von Willebrand factor type A (vWA) domain
MRSSQASAELGSRLSSRLAGFTGFLRANGYGVGGADTLGVLETAAQAGILDPQVLRWNLKALLCGRGEEWRRFDRLFDAYFLPPNRSLFVPGKGGGRVSPAEHDTPDSRAADATTRADGSAAAGDFAPTRHSSLEIESSRASGYGITGDLDHGAARQGASRGESLASTDFRDLNQAQQTYEIEQLMRRFSKRLKRLRLRREAAAHHGRRLDLQATIRRSVASGGTPMQLAWKRRRQIRPRLILLVDVSRSMSLYGFFYMRLARALCRELAEAYCFIFHTRLTEVSAALGDPDPWRSQQRLHLLATGWAGGTRIGECLQEFNRSHGVRLLNSRTGVIVVSDGYDTGEPALLAHALATLRRRSRRLVWLNPLLNQPGYTPQSRGMQAAMPHLDLLAAGADFASLERVLPQVLEALR